MTEPELRSEIERSPAVFSVLVEDNGEAALLGTLYAVQLPSSDLSRFRLWDDEDGYDVFFKLRGRWRRVDAVWMQLKGRDPAESRPVAIVTFGRKVLKEYGVKKWKPKK